MFSKQCKLVIKYFYQGHQQLVSHKKLTMNVYTIHKGYITHLCLTSSIKTIFIYSFYENIDMYAPLILGSIPFV